MRKRVLPVLLCGLLLGCAVGPEYRRPAADIPERFRGAAVPETSGPDNVSLGDRKWWEIFRDETLQELIRTALRENDDVRIAAARVAQARERVGLARADELPSISGAASSERQRNPQQVFLPAFETGVYRMNLSLSWELDFWGKYRRATESARADLLTAEWARQAVLSSLVSDVAGAWLRLRELDLELAIAKRTLASRRESLRLVRLEEEHGAVSMLDVRQAEQLVFTSGETVPELERRIGQQENLIRTLLGKSPGDVPRGTATEQPLPPEVPAGVPSSLLERRSDIRRAEEELIAMNARIGVAKAAWFPRIALTADGGYQSTALSALFSGPAQMWNIGGGLTQPIFEGGRIRSNVRLAEARREEASAAYRQAIRQAFRDVSDALISRRKFREFREQQEQLTRSAEEATRLSNLRYKGGAAGYLEVLDGETRQFSAELTLAQARLNEQLAFVQLYKALGGGWQP